MNIQQMKCNSANENIVQQHTLYFQVENKLRTKVAQNLLLEYLESRFHEILGVVLQSEIRRSNDLLK